MEADDSSPDGLDMEARFSRKHLDSRELGVSYFRYGPNVKPPYGHRHGSQEEAYVVVSGSGRLKLDDDVIDLKPLDAVRIHRETMRNIEGGPDGAELIAFGAPNTGPGDGPMTQGWWMD